MATPVGDRSKLPAGRIGTVEEIAELMVYLASDLSAYCTGADFVIDGGAAAGRSAHVRRPGPRPRRRTRRGFARSSGLARGRAVTYRDERRHQARRAGSLGEPSSTSQTRSPIAISYTSSQEGGGHRWAYRPCQRSPGSPRSSSTTPRSTRWMWPVGTPWPTPSSPRAGTRESGGDPSRPRAVASAPASTSRRSPPKAMRP